MLNDVTWWSQNGQCRTFTKCLKYKWIKLNLDEIPLFGNWCLIMSKEPKEGNLLFECNSCKADIFKVWVLYKEVRNYAWADFNPVLPLMTLESIQWENSHWQQCSVFCCTEKIQLYIIRGFLNEHCNLLICTSLIANFDITESLPFNTYYGIAKTITRSLKVNVRISGSSNDNVTLLIAFICLFLSDWIYTFNCFSRCFVHPPEALSGWDKWVC